MAHKKQAYFHFQKSDLNGINNNKKNLVKNVIAIPKVNMPK